MLDGTWETECCAILFGGTVVTKMSSPLDVSECCTTLRSRVVSCRCYWGAAEVLTRLCCCCGLIVTKLLPFVEFANLIPTWTSTWSRLQPRNKVCMMHPRSCLTPSVESNTCYDAYGNQHMLCSCYARDVHAALSCEARDCICLWLCCMRSRRVVTKMSSPLTENKYWV